MTEQTTTSSAPVARANENRSTLPEASAFRQTIGQHWADRPEPLPAERPGATAARARRHAMSGKFLGKRLIIPAGRTKQRSNDTDYPFRAHSAFSHLTGWGADSEPGAVLVLDPSGTSHTATLYFRERAGRDSDEFFANSEIGEFWIGPRPSLAQVAADLGVHTAHIDEFSLVNASGEFDATTLIVREADETLTRALDDKRASAPGTVATLAEQRLHDAELERELSELRLVKDDFEIAEMRTAIAATNAGFDDIVRELDRAVAETRGERVIEGVFHARARLDGNEVGYDTIAASGSHACILHWTKNNGPVRPGDLVLIDAGVEVESLYTADITRTLPVSGTFTPIQRKIYEAVLEAADAAFAIVKPGITFHDVHNEAMRVIAMKLAEWGLLPVSAEEALAPTGQHHRRYMVHGTSHHLGLDVHDCAKARREMYHDGIVQEGMIFTIEPGLYFQPDDLTVPAEYRGIGVRIEDDILVTATGAENLSAALPRTADEVEAWMRGARAAGN